MEWTPTDWGRSQLFSKWTEADPTAAARFKAEHPEKVPEYDPDPPVVPAPDG